MSNAYLGPSLVHVVTVAQFLVLAHNTLRTQKELPRYKLTFCVGVALAPVDCCVQWHVAQRAQQLNGRPSLMHSSQGMRLLAL